MLALVSERVGEDRPLILAARNVHAAFVRAAALLDLDAEFIYPERDGHLCRCEITPEDVRVAIERANKKPSAVYVTSPDYLGNILDIAGISAVCQEFDLPLLVDNAHGAYLKFLPEDIHPITLGAAMCADSAHKTLPVLTGGAYLHISGNYPEYAERARDALSLFASTSPSYLILSSLDLCNGRLAEGYAERIADTAEKIREIKQKITELGLPLCESEPMKIVINLGKGLRDHLCNMGVEVEFSDEEYTVLMLTPENSDEDFDRLLDALSIYKWEKSSLGLYSVRPHERACSIRRAVLSPSETVPVEKSVGRICASPTVSCPPAVPIVISGERITDEDVDIFRYYGINSVRIVKTDSI
jgi:arginine/lysine/ornithine decarboxylase